jgi:hypothetical protein
MRANRGRRKTCATLQRLAAGLSSVVSRSPSVPEPGNVLTAGYLIPCARDSALMRSLWPRRRMACAHRTRTIQTGCVGVSGSSSVPSSLQSNIAYLNYGFARLQKAHRFRQRRRQDLTLYLSAMARLRARVGHPPKSPSHCNHGVTYAAGSKRKGGLKVQCLEARHLLKDVLG